MSIGQAELVNKLRSEGVQFDVHDHVPVLTVQAQTEVLAGIPGTVVKNIFAKDKKHRLYIMSALPTTKIDMALLSARLGTGKGGLRFAPEELLGEALKVPPGSVTPLAIANPGTEKIVVFLDEGMRDHPSPLLVHPLVNTASLSMQPAALEQALRVLGREPIYIDFNADPKIDKDHPPDLAKYTVEPGEKPMVPDADAATANRAQAAPPAAAAGSSKPAGQQGQASTSGKGGAPTGGQKQGKKGAAKLAAPAAPSMYALHQAGTNVAAITEEVMQKVTQSLLSQDLATAAANTDSYALLRLRADVKSQLNTLKNTAYAMGYSAGKGAVVGYAQKQFA